MSVSPHPSLSPDGAQSVPHAANGPLLPDATPRIIYDERGAHTFVMASYAGDCVQCGGALGPITAEGAMQVRACLTDGCGVVHRPHPGRFTQAPMAWTPQAGGAR